MADTYWVPAIRISGPQKSETIMFRTNDDFIKAIQEHQRLQYGGCDKRDDLLKALQMPLHERLEYDPAVAFDAAIVRMFEENLDRARRHFARESRS